MSWIRVESMAEPAIVIMVIGGVLGLMAVHAYFIGLKCPKCNRVNALVRTGDTRKHGVWFLSQLTECHQCKHCGEVVWKHERGGG